MADKPPPPGTAWSSPEAAAKLRRSLELLEDQWRSRWKAKVGDGDVGRSLAVTRVLRAARFALEARDDASLKWLGDRARDYLDQSGSDVRANTQNEALYLRGCMLGWIRKRKTAAEVAPLFVRLVEHRPSDIRAELYRNGLSLKTDEERTFAEKLVRRALRRFMAESAAPRPPGAALSEVCVVAALRALGLPEDEADELFTGPIPRSLRPPPSGGDGG
jgi:hypothetical protein